MKNQHMLDAFDLEAEREALALNRFRHEIGLTKAKHKTRISRKSTNKHHYQGVKTGVWRGLPK